MGTSSVESKFAVTVERSVGGSRQCRSENAMQRGSCEFGQSTGVEECRQCVQGVESVSESETCCSESLAQQVTVKGFRACRGVTKSKKVSENGRDRCRCVLWFSEMVEKARGSVWQCTSKLEVRASAGR